VVSDVIIMQTITMRENVFVSFPVSVIDQTSKAPHWQ